VIALKVDKVKGLYFDRPAVTNAVDKATRQVLSKFGAFVRRRARTSMRKKKGNSPPGSPPYVQTGLLKQFLFFAFDPDKKSVVIGPALLNGTKQKGTAERLEYGGTLAGNGRVAYITNQVGRDQAGRFTSGGVTRVELNGTLTYRPRPFMRPALAAELPGLPAMWRDSVR
jgi:hypothetical protein